MASDNYRESDIFDRFWHGYDAVQENFDHCFNKRELSFVADNLSDTHMVLEVGGGKGKIGLHLSEGGKRTIFSDINKRLVKKCLETSQRKKIKMKDFVIFDARSLPFQGNSLAEIICIDTISFVSEPERFFREVRRVLKKDGVLVININNRSSVPFFVNKILDVSRLKQYALRKKNVTRPHYIRYDTLAYLKGLCQNSGLELKECRFFRIFPDFVIRFFHRKLQRTSFLDTVDKFVGKTPFRSFMLKVYIVAVRGG